MNSVETKRQLLFNRRESGVVFLLIDCVGKLNSLGASVMAELDVYLEMIKKDPTVKAIVMMSGKPDTFVIGADLFEIRKATTIAELHKLSADGHRNLDSVATMEIPVVIAINGACFGGGLELALACHWRIATVNPETIMALPETRLGLIPGLGGTQRLPRLIGLKEALGMILSADPITSQEALAKGLVDEVVSSDDLMEIAEKRALELAANPEKIKDRMELQTFAGWPLKDVDQEKANKLFAMTERSIRIKTKGNYPAQTKAIEVIKAGISEGMVQGLKLEAQAFAELAASEVSANLIALFFATDFAKQSAVGMAAKFDVHTKKVGILGGGTMGPAIANLAAASGFDVVVRVNPGREQALQERLAALPRVRVSEAVSEGAMDRIKCTSSFEDLRDCDLVIEAVAEDLAVKTELLKQVEAVVSESCTIASNTSSLRLSEVGAALKNSTRFVGLHFFHPVDRMALVEVVAMKGTNRRDIARCAGFVTRLGKIPVNVKDGPGFLINRLITSYMFESGRMADEGIPLNHVEEAALEFGMPMGPYELVDEIGMDVAFTVADTLNQAFGERLSPPALLTEAKSVGMVGRKTGVGIYNWDESGRRREFSENVQRLPITISPEKSDTATREAHARRLIFPMVDEAARCLEDKIVMKPREIDMAIVNGIGFPPFRGGLLKYADSVGLKTIAEHLTKQYAATGGQRQLSGLIQKYVAEGRDFYSRGDKGEEG